MTTGLTDEELAMLDECVCPKCQTREDWFIVIWTPSASLSQLAPRQISVSCPSCTASFAWDYFIEFLPWGKDMNL